MDILDQIQLPPITLRLEDMPAAVSVLSKKVDRLIELMERMPTREQVNAAIDPDKKMGIKATAEMIGVSRKTIYRWKLESNFPVHQHEGQHPYCFRGEVEKWLKTKGKALIAI